MTKLNKIVTAIAAVGALKTCVVDGWATPQAGQPALVASDRAAARLAPTGFDQAQGIGE